MVYSKVKDLPETIQSALISLGYNRSDIKIEAAESVSPSVGGGDGLRGFCCMVNIVTGETKTMIGSWGGSNAFTQSAINPVDSDYTNYKIPDNIAVIKGNEGGSHPVYATITVSTANIIKALPGVVELSPRDKWILYGYKGLTSAGRKNEYSRNNDVPSAADLKRLVDMGLLKQNAAGHCQITTAGKNCFRDLETVYHPKDR